MMERECKAAQLEIMQQTTKTRNQMYNALVEQGSPLAEDLAQYCNGARCTFPGYVCTQPCKFAEGVQLTRKI